MNELNNIKNKEVLLTLYDKDIFPDKLVVTGVAWKDRRTGKVVLFNKKDEIALVSNNVSGIFLLPGGGIEDGENNVEGVTRECREETGCEIEIFQELGYTEDYRARDSKHCISYGYMARVVSQGQPSHTENEADVGLYVRWFSLSDAIRLFAEQEEKVKRGEVKFYNTCFNVVRDFFFVRRARDFITTGIILK